MSAIDTSHTADTVPRARAPGLPRSATSSVTGLMGLAGLLLGISIAKAFHLKTGTASLIVLAFPILTMLISTVLVEKAWRNSHTGLDFTRSRSHAETMETTKVKLAGLAATLAILGLLYFVLAHYTMERYGFFFLTMMMLAPPAALFGVFYIYAVDKHMIEPRDHLWHFGMLVCGHGSQASMSEIAHHLRAWAVKGFFLAFMFSIVPGGVAAVLDFDWSKHASSPVAWGLFAISALFLVDIIFATAGYLLTFRLLDLHIRTANPFLLAWIAALACYPPFAIMAKNHMLDYHAGGAAWHVWLLDYPALLWIWAVMLAVLVLIYAGATVAFGLRFSNLTNRGTITSWPYCWLKHPAYVAKNTYWWLAAMPFLSTIDAVSAFRCSVLLLLVNLIYFIRAKTEEKHMMEDPDYRAYLVWIGEHGKLERLGRWVKGVVFGGRSPKT